MSVWDEIKDGVALGPLRRMHASRAGRKAMRAYADVGPDASPLELRRAYEIPARRPDPPGAMCHQCDVQGWHSTGAGRGCCAAVTPEHQAACSRRLRLQGLMDDNSALDIRHYG
jgi:hypothetical protein